VWLDFLDRLYAGTAAAAQDAVASLSDSDVIAFWSWNDREAALCIAECPADEIAEMAAGYRESLLTLVVDEIAYRAEV
jgi:hypothetical protein